MRRVIGETKPGTTVQVQLLREGKTVEIPVTVAALDEQALAEADRAARETMQRIGIAVEIVPPEIAREYGLREGEGVVVTGVARRGRFVGVKVGDVILSINGEAVNSPDEFLEVVGSLRQNQPITLVLRDAESERMISIR
jgi:serine protease Do